MALCTQADIEALLQITFTIDPDPVVAEYITDAQAIIEAEVGRALESDDRIETFDGAFGAIYVTNWPISAVDTVTEDGDTLTVDTDFLWYERGKIIRVSNGHRRWWSVTKPKSIVVEYTGGYLPGSFAYEHLNAICTEVAARAIRRSLDVVETPVGSSGPVQSVSLQGSDTVTYATSASTGFFAINPGQYVFLGDDELRQLQRYKRIVVT